MILIALLSGGDYADVSLTVSFACVIDLDTVYRVLKAVGPRLRVVLRFVGSVTSSWRHTRAVLVTFGSSSPDGARTCATRPKLTRGATYLVAGRWPFLPTSLTLESCKRTSIPWSTPRAGAQCEIAVTWICPA